MPFTRISRHADLVNRMAKATGADLAAAIWGGDLRAETLREAVLRCAGCAHARDCEQWLQTRAALAGRVTPPHYCRNRALLIGLAEGVEG
ncbi:hypothetical protein U879_17695 [Defluviimonas sp. 20V17]|nr:DUF6455 family protein [Allgaiera indica]KDB02366.1 hypothetical protein U879_17695 [Defluviimonas sp. 20V17]SDX07054.1 hypothetical protein SAMN05444006_109157 [Allgaiera indica]